MEFNEGKVPDKAGQYWLRANTTGDAPVKYEQTFFAWKCSCHPDELQNIPFENIKKNLDRGILEITGWIQLPESKK